MLKGHALLESTRFTLPDALSAAYPEHRFHYWRFKGGAPAKFWQTVAKTNDTETLMAYIDHIRQRLKLGSELSAWARISVQKQLTAGERSTLKKFGGLMAVLKVHAVVLTRKFGLLTRCL